jgi:hypothetical protein
MNCPYYIATSEASEEKLWWVHIDLIRVKPAPPVARSCPIAILIENELSKRIRKWLERLTMHYNIRILLRYLRHQLPGPVLTPIVENVNRFAPFQGCLQSVANDVCFILDNQKSKYLHSFSPSRQTAAPTSRS